MGKGVGLFVFKWGGKMGQGLSKYVKLLKT
jgi:hypothetical protein